jgi:hypothetical protein
MYITSPALLAQRRHNCPGCFKTPLSSPPIKLSGLLSVSDSVLITVSQKSERKMTASQDNNVTYSITSICISIWDHEILYADRSSKAEQLLIRSVL